MKRMGIPLLILATAAVTGISFAHGKDKPAEGVIGATCEAKPHCSSCTGNDNVCHTVTDRFYPGLLMAVAKRAVIKECEEANGLDECGNHCSDEKRKELIGKFGLCYSQCEKIATCIYGDNR